MQCVPCLYCKIIGGSAFEETFFEEVHLGEGHPEEGHCKKGNFGRAIEAEYTLEGEARVYSASKNKNSNVALK